MGEARLRHPYGGDPNRRGHLISPHARRTFPSGSALTRFRALIRRVHTTSPHSRAQPNFPISTHLIPPPHEQVTAGHRVGTPGDSGTGRATAAAYAAQERLQNQEAYGMTRRPSAERRRRLFNLPASDPTHGSPGAPPRVLPPPPSAPDAPNGRARARKIGKALGVATGIAGVAGAAYGGYRAYKSYKKRKAARDRMPQDELVNKANKAASRSSRMAAKRAKRAEKKMARYVRRANRSARKYSARRGSNIRKESIQSESTAVSKTATSVSDTVKKAKSHWKWARHSPNFHPTKYKMADLPKLASEGKRKVAGRVALGAIGTLAAVKAYKAYKGKGKKESVEESLSGMMLLAESGFGYSFDDQDEFLVSLMRAVAETNDSEIDSYLKEVLGSLHEVYKKPTAPGLAKRAAYTAAFGKEKAKGEVGEHPGAFGSFGWHLGAGLGTSAAAAMTKKKHRKKILDFAKKHSSTIKHVGAGVAGAGVVLGAHHLISKALQRRRAAKAKSKRKR